MEDQTWIKRVTGGHHHVVVVGVLAQTIHGNSIPEKGKILHGCKLLVTVIVFTGGHYDYVCYK